MACPTTTYNGVEIVDLSSATGEGAQALDATIRNIIDAVDIVSNDPTLGGESPSETVAPSQEAVQEFVAAQGAGATGPTVLTPSANLELPAPAASTVGAKAKYYITPSANITLTMNAAILIPSASSFVSQELLSGKLTIVQLEYNGSAWMLTTIVGGY